tara:strand:- start:475 stop:639 length:165 start_codon:yes stop_codon:yes gene_type:complete
MKPQEYIQNSLGINAVKRLLRRLLNLEIINNKINSRKNNKRAMHLKQPASDWLP